MTVDGTLDERYLTWLVRQIEPVTNLNPARSHWVLCSEMYKKEFTWFIPNDDNRLYDGLDLRQEFVDEEEGGDAPEIWLSEACSFLEMIIALARRMAFESTPLEPDYWFWRMMENLNLRIYVDEVYDDDVRILIDDILNRVIDRTYHADGSGGLFPLNHPGKDQREVELWYQSQQYLMENINV
jgi:hypothetical protein